MSDNIGNIPPEMSQADIDLAEELEAWQRKVAELQACCNLLKQENTQMKKKHSDMQQKLTIATESLGANARIFGELFEDSKTALQMCRDSYLNSTISVKTSTPKAEKVRSSPKRTASVAQPVRRRKIENLEPLHMHVEDLDLDEEQISDEVTSPINILSAIEEESHTEVTNPNLPANGEESGTASISVLPIGQPYVRVTLLPNDILALHLQKLSSDSSLENISSGEDSLLAFTPTKSKLEHMWGLGLSPANGLPKSFSRITLRKKESTSDEARSSSSSKKSVKSEEGQLKETETSRRPSRRAKPQGFKEPSLREKLRR